jgi:hypothetical protein
MSDQARSNDDRPLSLQLDVHLDRQPISGRLRTSGGAEERFVGWLGFVDALTRLHELQASADPATDESSPRGLVPKNERSQSNDPQ